MAVIIYEWDSNTQEIPALNQLDGLINEAILPNTRGTTQENDIVFVATVYNEKNDEYKYVAWHNHDEAPSWHDCFGIDAETEKDHEPIQPDMVYYRKYVWTTEQQEGE